MGLAAAAITGVLALVGSAAPGGPASPPAGTGRAEQSRPSCKIGAIKYDDQAGLISVKGGQCAASSSKGRTKALPAAWSFKWTGYDSTGATFGEGNTGAGKGMSFKLNPARFDHVKVTFTVTAPKTRHYLQASASQTQTIQTGGVGLESRALGSGPGTTPPSVVGDVSPLCPFTDPYLDRFFKGLAQCGTATPGACAFVTAPTMTDDTVRAGTWLCPPGNCAAPPSVAKGPYKWFGYNVFLTVGALCGDGTFFGAIGAVTISLTNADGSGCTLESDGWAAERFRIPPTWAGTLRVSFVGETVTNIRARPPVSQPPEYETAQFTLGGTQNGCTSGNWTIQSVQG